MFQCEGKTNNSSAGPFPPSSSYRDGRFSLRILLKISKMRSDEFPFPLIIAANPYCFWICASRTRTCTEFSIKSLAVQRWTYHRTFHRARAVSTSTDGSWSVRVLHNFFSDSNDIRSLSRGMICNTYIRNADTLLVPDSKAWENQLHICFSVYLYW